MNDDPSTPATGWLIVGALMAALATASMWVDPTPSPLAGTIDKAVPRYPVVVHEVINVHLPIEELAERLDQGGLEPRPDGELAADTGDAARPITR